MAVLIVIPARYGSTRFEGKPLAPLHAGPDGISQPLVKWTWDAAQRARRPTDRVVVATDDERILAAVREFAEERDCILTSETCANGTERCAETFAALWEDERFEIVVNLQGDAPLTPHWFVRDTIDALRRDPSAQVATPVLTADEETLAALRADRAAGRVGGTTAVVDRHGRALYFSKEVLPYDGGKGSSPVRLHVGLYAFRPEALTTYAVWPPGQLELAEGLEQLRFLENGQPILCVEADAKGRRLWEVNNPSDVPLVEEALARTVAPRK